jgi:hypothetical protein
VAFEHPTEAHFADAQTLASTLADVLREACDGRLGQISWFRADWQRGGAATGIASMRLDDGAEAGVVVKLPVVQRELIWTSRLQQGPDHEEDPVVPRLYASGDSLGGYDLAWIVIERLPHGPLGIQWHEDHGIRIADAAARFHAAAAAWPVDRPVRSEPWEDLLRAAAESVRLNPVDHKARWSAALRSFRGLLDRVLKAWEARRAEWLHGDLHLANAMSRTSLREGPVSLIDLAEVHPGHWVEDAVYLERQLWAWPERLRRARPVKAIAAARRARGLSVDPQDVHLAMVRRALLAGTAPAFLRSEGNPRHLSACLEWLERAVTELRGG